MVICEELRTTIANINTDLTESVIIKDENTETNISDNPDTNDGWVVVSWMDLQAVGDV